MSRPDNGQTASVIERREQIRDPGEPLLDMERRLQNYNGSILCNIPSEARDILNLTTGDDVGVEVYPDRVVIRPQLATDGGE